MTRLVHTRLLRTRVTDTVQVRVYYVRVYYVRYVSRVCNCMYHRYYVRYCTVRCNQQTSFRKANAVAQDGDVSLSPSCDKLRATDTAGATADKHI